MRPGAAHAPGCRTGPKRAGRRAATCNKRDERLRERPELVADRAAHGGRVGRQARRQRAARVLRRVEEGDFLRRGAAGSPVLVGSCFMVG